MEINRCKCEEREQGRKERNLVCEKESIAVQRYKKAGGGYRGKKSASNKLTKWTKQKWGYVTKGDSKKPRRKRGRYLPESVRKSLTPSQKAYENRKKRTATAKGKQRASYSKKVGKKVSRRTR